MHSPIKNKPDLKKNFGSGAIINSNKGEIAEARARKKARQADKERIETLENDLGEVKALLKELIGKL